ncbi:hypothetical protein GY45DRAFT_1376283 [Cubamyces sp. BRFM 1775]|nr:hypothetical protein GY45DRAFT_1376283 [Cubamyces sp. BRFM 1775]
MPKTRSKATRPDSTDILETQNSHKPRAATAVQPLPPSGLPTSEGQDTSTAGRAMRTAKGKAHKAWGALVPGHGRKRKVSTTSDTEDYPTMDVSTKQRKLDVHDVEAMDVDSKCATQSHRAPDINVDSEPEPLDTQKIAPSKGKHINRHHGSAGPSRISASVIQTSALHSSKSSHARTPPKPREEAQPDDTSTPPVSSDEADSENKEEDDFEDLEQDEHALAEAFATEEASWVDVAQPTPAATRCSNAKGANSQLSTTADSGPSCRRAENANCLAVATSTSKHRSSKRDPNLDEDNQNNYDPSPTKPRNTSQFNVRPKATKADAVEIPSWNDEEPSQMDVKEGHELSGVRPSQKPQKLCKSSEVDVADVESHPPSDIDLVWPKKGGKLGLKQQQPRVQEVARNSIGGLLASVCLEDAFPEGPEMHNHYARDALIKSAEHLGYADIATRLRNDKGYAKALATIPAQRVSTFRGHIKQVTDPLAPTAFGLKSGDSDYVIWLKESLRYIYPVDYAKDTYQANKPFGEPVYVQALRNTFFNSARSLDPQRPDEKELPAPMIALVSAAIYASISDYEFDVYEAGEFSADAYADVYAENMRILDHIKKNGPRKYHTLMHRLYQDVCGIASNSKKPAHGISNAIALLNLDDMDEA